MTKNNEIQEKEVSNYDSDKLIFGIFTTLFGLLLTIILMLTFGNDPLSSRYIPIYASLGIGVYFLGLSLVANSLFTPKNDFYKFNKKIDDFLLKINQKLDNSSKNSILKPEINDLIKIYELYQVRILKEYDLIWNRFKIYFSMNTGLLIVLSFLISIEKINDIAIPIPKMKFIIIFIAFIGFVISLAGILVNIDGKKWQNIMNQSLADVEKEIFSQEKYGLYSRILFNESKSDVLNINLIVFGIFEIFWIFLCIFSLYNL